MSADTAEIIESPAAEEPEADKGIAALRGIRAAFVFLSRVPVGGFPFSKRAWQWAPAHFPLVGVAVGALSGAAFLGTFRYHSTLAAVLAVVVSVLVTGAFHEDGLADSADAIGGSHGNNRLFEILKDSRIGSFGAVALVLVLFWRVACISTLGAHAPLALLVAHPLARTGPVWLLASMKYLTEGPSKGSQVGAAGAPQAFVATLWSGIGLGALVYLHIMPWRQAAILAGVAAGVTLLGGIYFKRRVGGITGDFLGAVEQVTECALLAAVLYLTRSLGLH